VKAPLTRAIWKLLLGACFHTRFVMRLLVDLMHAHPPPILAICAQASR
jgi:hypothetical protein